MNSIKFKAFFYPLLFSLILISCKTAEEVNSTSTPQGKRYAIGQGGGFTGDYSEFILGEDGKVFKYDFKYDREVFFKNVSKADLIYFLEKIEALSLDGMEMNSPGNMSYYIDVREGRTSINKLVWGHPNFYPDKDLVELHKEMFDSLSKWD